MQSERTTKKEEESIGRGNGQREKARCYRAEWTEGGGREGPARTSYLGSTKGPRRERNRRCGRESGFARSSNVARSVVARRTQERCARISWVLSASPLSSPRPAASGSSRCARGGRVERQFGGYEVAERANSRAQQTEDTHTRSGARLPVDVLHRTGSLRR